MPSTRALRSARTGGSPAPDTWASRPSRTSPGAAAAGHTAEAQNVTAIISELYQAFKGDPYPYGSEYTYDNTGEEAVYTAAKVERRYRPS